MEGLERTLTTLPFFYCLHFWSPLSFSYLCIPFIQTFVCQKNDLSPTPSRIQLLLPYNPLVLHIPDSWNWAVRTQVLTILWIRHLRDHQCHLCWCHPVSLCLLLLSDHPQQHIIHYLITYLQAYLLHSLPAWLPFLPPLLVPDCHAIILSAYSSLQSPGHSFGFKLHLADL